RNDHCVETLRRSVRRPTSTAFSGRAARRRNGHHRPDRRGTQMTKNFSDLISSLPEERQQKISDRVDQLLQRAVDDQGCDPITAELVDEAERLHNEGHQIDEPSMIVTVGNLPTPEVVPSVPPEEPESIVHNPLINEGELIPVRVKGKSRWFKVTSFSLEGVVL